MRVLLVEDEQKIAKALQRALSQEGFAVDVSFDGDGGSSMALTEPYDVVILDRMLPGSIDGIGIVKQMRAQHINTPVLLLTAKDAIEDRVAGLNAGADDYLTKPFALAELVARIRALLRRPPGVTENTLVYKDLELDPHHFVVTRRGQRIPLTVKEFALLEYFMRNPDRVLTKDMITQHVWNYDADILPNTVEVYVGYLRAKIDRPFKDDPLIHTRRGFGYVFGENRVS